MSTSTEKDGGVVLALSNRSSLLGAAFLAKTSGALCVVADTADYPPFDAALTRKFTSLKLPNLVAPSAGDRVRQTVSFSGAQSTDRMAMALYLESIASLANEQMVGSVGALLSYLAKSASLAIANDDGNVNNNHDTSMNDFQVKSVESFQIDNCMNLSQDCYDSLNIFCNEKHPSMFSSNNKEGLSLFGLLNLTHSTLGKLLLQKWFLAPSLDIRVIQARQDAIAQFLKPNHEDCVMRLRDAIEFIGNIPRICQRLKQKINIQEWESLLKFSFYALKIRTVCENFKNLPIPLFEEIDFEASLVASNVVVKLGVDEMLDDMKHSFDGLDDLLSTVAKDIAKAIPDSFSDSLNVIYFPQLGYLITVPLQPHMTTQESFIIESLDFQFCTSKTVFYKSHQMYEMDETIGDLHSIICDKEIEIIHSLQSSITEYSDFLIQLSETCAELDCLLALAESAQKYDFVRPQVVDADILEITDGRHPLYEQCMDNFIGNSTRFGRFVEPNASDASLSPLLSAQKFGKKDDDSCTGGSEHTGAVVEEFKVLLLTGPNFSGKSVYLKQVGMIVFMAHIGSYVPANKAVIGITDKIITRIQAVESDTKVNSSFFPEIQSAFMIDSQQIAYALRNSTPRSLILIDEYGKGTLHSNGVGLFCATLMNFLDRGRECPNVLATTHF
ncbi:MutS protein msh5, partial [Physocladia obscura]